jgi:hypothetical protein
MKNHTKSRKKTTGISHQEEGAPKRLTTFGARTFPTVRTTSTVQD